ncbi:MAG: ATP-binding protein [Blastocatellia bacterium]|nr:ATP-binding protein [Blastocatellia bacterium]
MTRSGNASEMGNRTGRKTEPTKKTPADRSERALYPFSAIVGQEEMKLALLLSVIDPYIGGVIIMGHRGTAKSTAVRALADLLPPLVKVKGCLYGCDPDRPVEYCHDCAAAEETRRQLTRLRVGDTETRRKSSLPASPRLPFPASVKRLPRERGPVPVVDLPLGATEDRVCGTLDIERALVEGVKAFEPGLLARANRGFLYIDEVNLLDDHLVDVLLDAAASGRNTVEREGISVSHPARFVLVGSGNPEEGDLRPQLLDRFGLYTQITTITDIDLRVEIVERRERFERDPEGFREEYGPEQHGLRRRLSRAKKAYSKVEIARELLRRIAELCLSLEVDGHRGELTITRAARALAAFEGRARASVEDVRRVAVMSLRHRLRKGALEKIDSGLRIEQALERVFPKTIAGTRLAAIK